MRDMTMEFCSEVSLNPASADRGRTMLDLRQLPAGVYFVRFSANGVTASRRVTLVR